MSLCLITGGNGGIGSGVIRSLLASGRRDIVCTYRADSSKIEAILSEFDLRPNERMFKADLSDEDEVRALREAISSKLGDVSSIVNLAGGTTNAMSWKISLSDFRKVMDMNLTSTFLVCREFLPIMREAAAGRIVNTSSVVACTGAFGASHYAAAKAAITGFSKSLSLEVANKGITVNTVALGYFNAGLIDMVPQAVQDQLQTKIPLGRLGRPEDASGLIEFLLSERASYVTGQVFHVNGGLL